jgi:hypothetical protein
MRLTRDAGSDRETRTRLCALRPWCVLHEHHAGACVEVERRKHEAPDYGPGRKR